MITSTEFAQRRQKLFSSLGADALAIVPAAPLVYRNSDANYRYRQNSHFYYLTGFNEPDAVAIFAPGRSEGEFLLFSRKHDPDKEVWVGKWAGQDGAIKDYGAAQAFPIENLAEKLRPLLSAYPNIYYPFGLSEKFEQQLWQWLENTTSQKVLLRNNKARQYIDLNPLLGEMRLYKSPAEIALLRKAAQVSAQGHIRAMRACQPRMKEYQLEAELLYGFAAEGCYPPGYSSIVASGPNACILHYEENNGPLNDNELVLIDAAGEYHNYGADITRTFPINGRFSEPQRAIYELVLQTQEAIIKSIKPGIAFESLQQKTVALLTEGLVKLKILSGDPAQLIAQKAYLPFYMHNVSHWLGLDTHDAGSYQSNGKSRLLEAGMVLTVEPGLYFRPDPTIDKQWWNIGVRIEDDILVTENGYDILSQDAPKKITDLENLIGEKV